MRGREQSSLEEAVRSYALWWRDAGLHCATESGAHGWRTARPAPFWQETPGADRAQPPEISAAPALTTAPVAHAPAPASIAAPMPGDLPAFLAWLASDPDQPEATWSGPQILPPLREQMRLLFIVEMPWAQASDGETVLAPEQRHFVEAMAASLGLNADDMAIASLATRRPPGSLLDEATLARLAERMTHYLGLARPGGAVILSDRTSRALIGAPWRPGMDILPEIAHSGGGTSAVALPGPDLLMNRPAAKARSWQALRLLHGVLNG
ncbi:hypothetical protein [Sphingobium lignivorans]|uniref:Uncharacterized protein n=1 Tax=Sphingobium lignivorans TaxID=2735886 RepID=A0ABR6NGF7_9SPHN|nr:hypothetical protein [Sphingobium lignivorans]MBB5986367.1 hypothetical protein [Sphingobium lignivorans]